MCVCVCASECISIHRHIHTHNTHIGLKAEKTKMYQDALSIKRSSICLYLVLSHSHKEIKKCAVIVSHCWDALH